MDWRTISKIDSHVHILPEDRRQGFIRYQGEDSTWSKAELSSYIDYMEEYNIKKAILQPTNNSYMYYSSRKTNEFLSEIVKEYPEKFMAFADINFNWSYILNEAPRELEYAIKKLGLHGLKFILIIWI